MYKIKLNNDYYVMFEQIAELEVEVYGVEIEDAIPFKSLEEAERIAQAINNGKDGHFTLISDNKAVSIVECTVTNIISYFDVL